MVLCVKYLKSCFAFADAHTHTHKECFKILSFWFKQYEMTKKKKVVAYFPFPPDDIIKLNFPGIRKMNLI